MLDPYQSVMLYRFEHMSEQDRRYAEEQTGRAVAAVAGMTTGWRRPVRRLLSLRPARGRRIADPVVGQ